ncbi:MAG: ABC transporter permease [Lachnospiraceae bacterium]|nr:ABC transporter permease [Lachnospiraceae bacterium]
MLLTILLTLFFLIDNILLSLSGYIVNHMQEHLDARTLIVQGMIDDENPDISKKELSELEEYLNNTDGITSWIMEEESVAFSYDTDSDNIRFTAYGCDYEAIKDYILTENCHEPKEDEIIIAKYYTSSENDFDIGSYLLSFDSLNRKQITMDGEELVGQTITGNVVCSVLGGGYIYLEKELKVIGVFDNFEMGRGCSLYVNNDTLAAWHDEAEEMNNFDPKENVFYMDLYDTFPHAVTCETRADLIALERYIDNNFETLSYYCRSSLLEIQSTALQMLMMVGNFVLIFFLINLAINIIYTEEHEVYIRRREYGLMKAVGYENSQLGLFHMRDTIKNIVLSFLATFLIGSVVIFVMNTLMAPLLNILFYTFRIKVLAGVCVIVVLAGLASVGVGSIRGLMQVWKMEAVDALKSEE